MLTDIGEALGMREASKESNQDLRVGKGERRVLYVDGRADQGHRAHVVKADIAHRKGKGSLAVRSSGGTITDMEHTEELNGVGGGDGALEGMGMEGR